MHWAYLLVAIVAEIIGTSALKLSDGWTRIGPLITTLVSYGVAFYCLAIVLRTMPVGIAYALWSGIGIVLIIAGVVVINLFSNITNHG